MSEINEIKYSTKNVEDQENIVSDEDTKIKNEMNQNELLLLRLQLIEKEKELLHYKNKLNKYKLKEDIYLEAINNKRVSKNPYTDIFILNKPSEEKDIELIHNDELKESVIRNVGRAVIADPHYDKALLDRDDARDVIMYIYNNLLNKEVANDAFNILYSETRGIPNTFLTKVVDVIGEYVYGPNNYIGPFKTGYAEGSLEDILTNAAALSEVDARARVHDVATAISDQENLISKDLPTETRVASQLFSPGFHAGYSRKGRDRHEQIKLSGDVEENPGPRFQKPPKRTLLDRAEEMNEFYRTMCWKAYSTLGYDAEDLVNYSINKYGMNQANQFWTDAMAEADSSGDVLDENLIRTLLIRGGVEQNPGPPSNQDINMKELIDKSKTVEITQKSKASAFLDKSVNAKYSTCASSFKPNTYRFDTPGAEMDKILEFASNPCNANSFLTAAIGDDVVNIQGYINDMYGSVPLVSALDNRTDIAVPSSNNIMIAGYNTAGTNNADFMNSGARLFRYSLQNKELRSKLSNGDLGAGLDGATKIFTDFLAVGRTNTNALSGDPMLEINSRIVAADFGDYINLSKLLAYTSMTEAAWGSVLDRNVPDFMCRSRRCRNGANGWFPGSLNAFVQDAARVPVINTWWMNQTDLREVLMGTITLPNGLIWNDVNECAFIPISRGYSLDAMALITMCYLEYPIFTTNVAGNFDETVKMNVTGTAPTITATSLNRVATEQMRVDGPKFNIIYLITDNSDDNLQVGPALYAQNAFTGVAIDMAATLENYWNNNIAVNVWGGYAEAMEYFLKFSSADDWVASCVVASTLIKTRCAYPMNQLVGGAVLASIPQPVMEAAVVTNVNIPMYELPNVAGRSLNYYSYLTLLPQYNCFGFPDSRNVRPALAVNNQPRAPSITIGFFQDNTPLLRYGIMLGCIRKNVLSGTTVSAMYKANRRPIVYSLFKIFEIIADMAGTWYQDRRIANMHIYQTGALTTNRRAQILSTLAQHTNDWQRTLCGIPFLRCGASQMPVDSNNLSFVNVGNGPAWLTSMLILNNKYIYDKYYVVPCQTNMIYGKIYDKGWEQAFTPQFQVLGLPIAGPGSQCVPKATMYRDVQDHGDANAEIMYAISRMKHYADPGTINSYLNIYMCDTARKNAMTLRPITQFWSELLACTSATFPISNWSLSRSGLITTAPFYPAEYNPIDGLFLTVGISNNGYITSYQPGYSLEGVGSANAINTDSFYAPGDKELTLSSSSNLF